MESPGERDACGVGFVADRLGRPTHDLLELAVEALRRVRHRGALDADARSGDGAGLLAPIPPGIFGPRGVGMLFLPRGAEDRARTLVEEALAEEHLPIHGWREVPVDPSALGERARRTMPLVEQVQFGRPPTGDAERVAFRARKRIEGAARREGVGVYACSLSFATVTYKGLCAADQLSAFYPDLADTRFAASFAVYHQRFSTNTAPSWERAQPFRGLCHNGEINTVGGNALAMRARLRNLGAAGLAPLSLLEPILDETGSDSSMLDEAVELLVRGGRSIQHALSMLVPPAWEHDEEIEPEVRAFHRFHACLAEPWDGPAALVFTDGRLVGARLDRNGLRPLRYVVCEDGLVSCGSEAGLVDLDDRGPVIRGRLGPGQMLLLDPVAGEVVWDHEATARLASMRPWEAWVRAHLREAEPGEPLPGEDEGLADLVPRQVAHGYTKEEVTVVLRPMATTGCEPVSSMGDDTAEPPLANRPRPVFGYLKQRFAQVTNPPIDPLHERLVTSLATRIGPRGPVLRERPQSAALIELPTFLLFPCGLERLLREVPWPVAELDATFPMLDGPRGLERACRRLAREGERAARDGAGLLVIDDGAVGPERAPVPSVLALGAVQRRLIAAGLRSKVSIVVNSGEPRDPHHVAVLLGYGADAIIPRMALETIRALCREGRMGGQDLPGAEEAQRRFHTALEEGVRKIMSKMGISTVDGYRGAQLFEAIGLDPEVVDLCLAGTPSVLPGAGFERLGTDVLELHARAFHGQRPTLSNPGFVKHRAAGEIHAINPDLVGALHEAVGLGVSADLEAAGLPPLSRSREGRAAYERFAGLTESRPALDPRDLLEVVPAGPPVPLEEVEPVSSIVRRFSSGAMSHGALSSEAHETLAAGLAMIGARANCGEGGEDPARFRGERNSPIKQVASARFGVTPEYLVFAEELQIKIAQGAKPGEGGQLPAHKVTETIARLRHTRAGIPLISPPPHHDIYSIEDLAQLIHDLRQVNPRADISVKLVATTGVGVVAVGVTKALADVISISGGEGGTGASPLSSIKNAGLPWEAGLSEAQRELVASGLRDRVRLRVDGGIKTGRDVLIAALLGAEEVSFGTAALLALGCIMVRACHRDTCPTGIATQRPELRARFAGKPEHAATYFLHVAEEVRGLLATLGLRSVPEAVGRVELLRRRDRATSGGIGPEPRLDVSELLGEPGPGARRFASCVPTQRPRASLGDRISSEALNPVREGRSITLSHRIANGDRSVGARLSGELARTFGSSTPRGHVRVRLLGQAGQSFGAFLGRGVELHLTGEANDYVCKGMSGGLVSITPPGNDAGDPVLAGNTVLYGATGGGLFCAGRAGERFAVRNSGATAVVEGVGDHACEYMTGGTVVVLGPVGRNLGAGMSGGVCFVYDPDGALPARVNPDRVAMGRLNGGAAVRVRTLLQRHVELTGSPRGKALLRDWSNTVAAFRVVAPAATEQLADGTQHVEGERPWRVLAAAEPGLSG